MRNQEVSSLTSKKGLKTVFLSSVIGFVFIFVLTAIMAFLLTRSKVTNDKIYYIEFLILAAGALLAGFAAAKKGRRKGIVMGIAAAIPVVAVFLLIPYFIFESEATKWVLISVPIIIVFSIIGGIIGANRR